MFALPNRTSEPPNGALKRGRGHFLPGWLSALLALLAIQRIVYHSLYLRDVPFAIGTFSDGKMYEVAAFDLLRHWPLGTQPHYLQGIYAYFLALPMHIKPWLSLGLFLQIVLGALALWVFCRTATMAHGRIAGALSTVVLMAYPALAFYENKYLTAEIGVVANIACLWTLSGFLRRPSRSWAAAMGVATGLSVLARGNMALAVPLNFAALIWACRARDQAARPRLAAWVAALLLCVAPLAVRNALVTSQPTIFPSHGGGTSFFIGNNPHANGVWNDGGGLLSGDVSHEREELARRIGVRSSNRATLDAEIGRELYARAWAFIRDEPTAWVRLELKKVWFVAGNDELTQDYDRLGERALMADSWATTLGQDVEAERSWSAQALATFTMAGIPFGVVLGLGVMGAMMLLRRVRNGDEEAMAWGLLLGGQVLAILVANVAFFTSSQHRVPLAIPLAFLAGPALVRVWCGVRRPPTDRRATGLWLAVGFGLALQAIAPRARRVEVSAVHYYNLAVVQQWIGEPRQALDTLDQALRERPREPLFLLERAKLNLRFDYVYESLWDLDALDALPDNPAWVVEDSRKVRMWALIALEELGEDLPRRQVSGTLKP